MLLRIDHIAIAVRDYPAARNFFETLSTLVPGASATDETKKYTWQLLSLGDLSRLELLSPTGEGSFLDSFLKNREGGFHHITLQTGDIQEAKSRLEQNGIPYFGYNEYPGNVWKELFIHPKHAFGVLIQIAEFQADHWLAPSLHLKQGKKWELTSGADGVGIKFAHPGGGTVTLDLTRDEVRQLMDELGNLT